MTGLYDIVYYSRLIDAECDTDRLKERIARFAMPKHMPNPPMSRGKNTCMFHGVTEGSVVVRQVTTCWLHIQCPTAM